MTNEEKARRVIKLYNTISNLNPARRERDFGFMWAANKCNEGNLKQRTANRAALFNKLHNHPDIAALL